MITVFCKDIKGKLRRIEVDGDVSIVNNQIDIKNRLSKEARIYASGPVLALMNGTKPALDTAPALA